MPQLSKAVKTGRSTAISALLMLSCFVVSAMAQSNGAACNSTSAGSGNGSVDCSEAPPFVPVIVGKPYLSARSILIEAGWQPLLNDPDLGSSWARRLGNGPILWRAGYFEVVTCAPTGAANCVFYFFTPDGTYLRVVTTGAATESDLSPITVTSATLVAAERATSEISMANE